MPRHLRNGIAIVVSSCALVLACLLKACAALPAGATELTASSARLNAKGRTETDKAAYFWFEYGPSSEAAYTGRSPTTRAPAGIPADTPFYWDAYDLRPDTEYRYRLCGYDDVQP